jgi:hypothetical protein
MKSKSGCLGTAENESREQNKKIKLGALGIAENES